MTVTVNISGLEPIAEAIDRLAQAIGSGGVSTKLLTNAASDAPTMHQMLQPVPQNQAGNPELGALGSTPGALPTTPASQLWPAIQPPQPNGDSRLPAQPPTTTMPQAYTQDQIAVAMTGLVDQGKQPQVMQVLAQFGAASLMQVPKEQYPALATQLRVLGANL